ncbi:MAG: transglutaminase family protein [Promethearchaeota archaeon]
MKKKPLFFITYLFLFSFAITIFSSAQHSLTFYHRFSSFSNRVSNYNITQSVTYQLEINFSLTNNWGLGYYIFKFARLNNRTPDSPLTRYCPPYQECVMLYNRISGNKPTETMMGHHDKFNNTFDSFNASLYSEQKVELDQKYHIKLNEIYFEEIKNSEIGNYDTSDKIFELYCNKSEPYYERDDPSLINLSNSLVNRDDNPVVKAEKIYSWVSSNIAYTEELPPQEKGALWAFNNAKGDCSEYSSLMITLLRIQGIPARKVMGFVVSNDPSKKPEIGDKWSFYSSKSSSNILGHAWVEYYVPNIGWIACDPTWSSGDNYFNRIDYLRFTVTVGANFFFPPSETISEFSNPIFGYSKSALFEFAYNVQITVIDTDLKSTNLIPFIPPIIIIGIFSIVIIIQIGIIKKRSKKKIYN